MKTAMFGTRAIVALTFLLATSILNATNAWASPSPQDAAARDDRQIQTDLTRELNGSRFKSIQVTVLNGVVDLEGSVDLFADKEEADRRAHHAKNAMAIRNQLRVAGPQVSDQELRAKLMQKLEYDRVGYGTTAFNAIGIDVRDGVVRLGGHAYSPTDKSSALSVVSYTPGVQDVIDEIEVDPVSPMDDRIRLNVARAVYGHSSLNKYALDPGKPIRISVQNGNVTLFGVVNTAADRDIANIRANGVPGVFKVVNELRVESDTSEAAK